MGTGSKGIKDGDGEVSVYIMTMSNSLGVEMGTRNF